MPTEIPPTCVVTSTTQHTATVIFLHGLGQSGLDWRPAVDTIKDELPHIKWLLPNAPIRSMTVNDGQKRPGWFDLVSFNFQDKEFVQDRDGLLESAHMIDEYIQGEINAGIPPERIVVGGFSQGGTLSLLVGLTDREGGEGWKLGGVFPMCNWIPLGAEFAKMISPHLAETPVLMCHGTVDDLVTNDMVHHARTLLTDLGLPVLGDEALVMGENRLGSPGLISKSYDGVGHEVSQEMLEDLGQFLKRVLPDD
ncbi:Phospholipase/Carboxylesterase-domain-containing protein [Chiua virens]|nr:Phospholipase/Carboxylesterase-domain-containing protein [Chiua virens]